MPSPYSQPRSVNSMAIGVPSHLASWRRLWSMFRRLGTGQSSAQHSPNRR
jgi:hypothetical protein